MNVNIVIMVHVLFLGVLDTINKQGFKFPSPIQSQAWPYLLSGKDVIGIAQTGTGKTLAFLLPAMIHIDNQKLPRGKRGGPNVLVLAPTRELAQQISMEVAKYEYKGIKSVCVYGGGSVREQTKVMIFFLKSVTFDYLCWSQSYSMSYEM